MAIGTRSLKRGEADAGLQHEHEQDLVGGVGVDEMASEAKTPAVGATPSSARTPLADAGAPSGPVWRTGRTTSPRSRAPVRAIATDPTRLVATSVPAVVGSTRSGMGYGPAVRRPSRDRSHWRRPEDVRRARRRRRLWSGRLRLAAAARPATATPSPSSTAGPRRSTAWRRTSPGTTVAGVGFDRDRLVAAGIEEAGALAAVTNGDNSNILVARVARETFGIERVVARIYDPRRAVIYERLGIPTVATVAWTTEQVLRRLVPRAPARRVDRPDGQGLLVERGARRAWAGHKIADLEEAVGARVVGHHPPGRRPRSDGPDTVAQDGDVLYMAAEATRLDRVRRRRCRRRQEGPLMRVVIAGGGSVGTLHRRAAAGGGPHGADRRERHDAWSPRPHAPVSPTASTWVDADACELGTLAGAGRRAAPTWSPRSPATTRTTS